MVTSVDGMFQFEKEEREKQIHLNTNSHTGKRIMMNAEVNFINFDGQISTKDITQEVASFLMFALLKDVLIQIPHYEHNLTVEYDETTAKQQMIEQLRVFHADNPVQLEKVDDFNEYYDCKDMAVYVYSKDACIHQPINVALRIKDIDALVNYRYFISHLCNDLVDQANAYQRDHADDPPFHVYRGQILSEREIEQLRGSVNKLITMNGFCSTSRNRDMAMKFAKNVLFDIEVDLKKNPGLTFADISSNSQFQEEEEVLFDLVTVFRIEKVVEEENSLIHIYLTASNEGRQLVDQYIALQRAEMPNFSLIMMFGRVLCSMGEYSKARVHFERLAEAGREDAASIQHNLGYVHDLQQNFQEALRHYEQASSSLSEVDPPRLVELAATFNNMATVFSQIGEHRQALVYFLQSLSLLKDFHHPDHLDIAGAYNNLGRVYRDIGYLEDSLQHHRQALDIYRRNNLPTVHRDIADCIHNMAIVHHDQEEYEQARALYEESLSIRKQCQLPNHPDIASNINDIGYLLCDQEELEEGFIYFEQAYDMRQANEGGNRMDLADSLNNMGVVYRHRGNIDLAIESYTKALDIYKAVLPPDHELLVKTQGNLDIAQALKLSLQENAD